MKIHQEGRKTLIITLAIALIVWLIAYYLIFSTWIKIGLLVLFLYVFYRILRFFRCPTRLPNATPNGVVSPCDGLIKEIKEVEMNEFLSQRMVRVSIFMSLYNVHVNWYPVAGRVRYYQYHPGEKMVAWHPKSSEKNEHTTLFVQTGPHCIGVRQIAGLIARRIVCYAQPGLDVSQGSEIGIIRFGSRVDLFLPLSAQLKVKVGDKVEGCTTLIATL